MGELFVESDERSSTEEILSVSVANGIYPASESERDTNPGASIANYKIVRVGDIVYNSMRMWQGAVGSSRYNGIVSPAYVVAKPVVELDSTCFGYLLKRPELLYKYLCNSQGNSKDTQTLRYERFAEITAEVPSTIEEQRAISDCLEGLDSLITLHQRKRKYRGLYGYLSWEQRKLGDMGTTYGGLTGKSKEDFGHGAAWFVPYTNVFDNPVGDSTRLERVEIDPSQNVVRRGDALFTVSSETPEEVGMSSVWPSDLDDLYLNSFCFGYRQDGSFDPSYLAYMLRADSFRNQIEMLAQGISRFNISKGKVMEIEVPVPNKREQARIGRLFVDLGSLITLHQ